MQDLHILPKVRDSWSHLYIEHARVDQDAKSIAVHDAQGVTPVPCASLMLLMLGPGTTITHAAIRTLAEAGCLVAWVGEEAVRYYAQGVGETRSSRRYLHQARLWANDESRLKVVMRMYRMRFGDTVPEGLTLQQIRGMEGVRVRQAYAVASRESGVAWHGRTYDRGKWQAADPVNRALSTANASLYGVSHAAIVAAGYSTALGFIHTGRLLSFVYDIADLYKVEMTIPAAFQQASQGSHDLERRVRIACRDSFHELGLLKRIVDDIDTVLGVGRGDGIDLAIDRETSLPGGLWDGGYLETSGGENYGREEEDDDSNPGAGDAIVTGGTDEVDAGGESGSVRGEDFSDGA